MTLVTDPPRRARLVRQDVRVYARHSSDCKFQGEKNKGKCPCPKWLYHSGTRKRESAFTNSWTEAERRAQAVNDSFDPDKQELIALREKNTQRAKRSEVRVEEALDLWIADKITSKAEPGTVSKCKTLGRQLRLFCDERGVQHLHQINTSLLTKWRASWQNKRTTGMRNKQQLTVSFFSFCVRQGHLESNPAGGRQNPNGGLSKILGDDWVAMIPFSREQYAIIVRTCEDMELKSVNQRDCQDSAKRLSVFLQVMRWSGLAIQDTAILRRDQLGDDNVLHIRRAKSRKPVDVVLPDAVAHALRTVPPGRNPHPDYFFWSGAGTKKSAATLWWRNFTRLWKSIDPPLVLRDRDGNLHRPHPHMFRCTFAVEFLRSRQGDIHDVAHLLGNTIKICEKHYLPLVPELGTELMDRVRASWKAQGAPGLHH